MTILTSEGAHPVVRCLDLIISTFRAHNVIVVSILPADIFFTKISGCKYGANLVERLLLRANGVAAAECGGTIAQHTGLTDLNAPVTDGVRIPKTCVLIADSFV